MKKKIGLFVGVAVFVVMLFFRSPSGLSESGWHTLAVALLMAVWWITEAVPLAVTALIPIIFFPVLGIATVEATTSPYANSVIFLFMGGFVLAIAMQKWELHRRLALKILSLMGANPKAIIFGFILSTAFISMWVSNTATALMMLPIAISVLELISTQAESNLERNFGVVLVLSIAYSSSIGGIGTLIGSPPNALFAGFMDSTYGISISFIDWMKVGVPIMIVSLPLMFYLLITIYPIRLKEIPGGKEMINRELRSLGKMGFEEKMVALVFLLAAAMWSFSPLIKEVIPGFSDTGVAIFVAFLLFLLPARKEAKGNLISWSDTRQLPWGILLLFGGGLSVAKAITTTKLADWIGQSIAHLQALPLALLIAIALIAILTVTELMSNTAATATFLPIAASIAIGLKQDPLLLAVPITIAASCAFMLPVSTPPNAVVYSSGQVTISQMLKAGLLLDLVFLVLLLIASLTLIRFVFGGVHSGLFVILL